MINKGDTVMVIYKDVPFEEYFGQSGEVTLVESLDGTKVIHVRFNDGKVIGFTESELQRIRRGSNV